MQYIICNENNYLHRNKNNKYEIIHDINKATKYDDIQKANNVLGNNCIKFKDLNLEIKNILEDDILEEDNEVKSTVKPIELQYDILEKVKEIHSFTKELEERKLYLLEELSKVDLEIVDIEHAAEFYNLNASQGYKLYKLLHNSRIKRREIKDELQKINYTLGISIRSINVANLESRILGLDNRKYTPRINKELFGV